MTVAQIREAARLLEKEDPKDIVSFNEIGSEGSVLVLGTWLQRRARWLIWRDGSSIKREV